METKNKKVLQYLLSMLLLLIPLSALGFEDNLKLLVWEGYTPKKHVEQFENEMEIKYGRRVKLYITYAGSVDDFYDAIREKSFDLVTISHHTIKDDRFDYIKKKLIISFDLKNIKNHVNVIPLLKMASYHSHKGEVYGIPVANGPYGLAYNTSVFKQAPKSWKIFWDPAYKNKYVIGAHEYLYNINITALAMGYPRNDINNFDTLNNKKFRTKLRQLTLNSHSLWTGVDKPEDLLGMSFATSWGDSLSSLKRKGEIWKMADPVEGTMWWIDEYALTQALVEKPFIKKIAEEWINKSLSPAFQVDHLIREVGIYPVVTNIVDKLTDDEKNRVQISSLPGDFTDKRILQNTYSQRDRNGLKLLWDEAMKGITLKGKNE
ncbi:MAG: extracellular solute-binding protein [Desulfobacteraceae bacterium]|nr:extracellular solute-binding protein [Desulfobacteraceae bacterium]